MNTDDYTNLIFEYFSKKNHCSQEKQDCSKTHLSREETSACHEKKHQLLYGIYWSIWYNKWEQIIAIAPSGKYRLL